jgi:hypothetical protein
MDWPGPFGFYSPRKHAGSHKWGMFESSLTAHNSRRCCHNIRTTDPANTIRHEKRLNLVSQRRPFKDFQKPPCGGFFFAVRRVSHFFSSVLLSGLASKAPMNNQRAR